MSSDVLDLTSSSEPRGYKRSGSKLINDRPRKRECRGISTFSTAPSIGPSRESRQPSMPQVHRFPGDGLDFRRPAPTSGSAGNPIDLSDIDDEFEDIDDDISIHMPPSRPASRPPPADPDTTHPPGRGPRFSRPIINVEDNDHLNHQHHQMPPNDSLATGWSLPSFRTLTRGLYGNTVLNPQANLPVRREHQHPEARPLPPHAPIHVIDDEDEAGEEDPEEAIHTAAIDAQMARNRASGRPALNGIRGGQNYSRASNLIRRVRSHHERPAGRAGYPNIRMNFFQTGFNFFGQNAVEPEALHVHQPTPPPQYDPLPACPEGFTRSPIRGEELICPRCERELCTDDEENEGAQELGSKTANQSKDDAARGEVWVVKACGHVYCGTCSRSRAARAPSGRKKSSPKGKQKASSLSPFANCVVDGCGEKVTGKTAMIQLFL